MNLLIAIPTIITLSIALIICIMIIMRDSKRHKFLRTGELTFGEDSFQRECEFKNGGRTSLVCASFILDIEDEDLLKNKIDTVVNNTQNFTLEYFKKYPAIYNKINAKKLSKENTLDNIYHNMELNYDAFPLVIIYSYPLKQILIIMDHTYIGGYFFQEWGTYTFGGEKTKPYNLEYTPGLTELISMRFLLFDALPTKFRPKSDLVMLKTRHKIKRVGIKYNVDELHKKYKHKPKICLIYVLSQLMFKYMNLDRKANIIIPVAFKNNIYSYNNVGALMLSIDKDDTPDIIFKKAKEKEYQTLATNHLMQLVNKGEEVRTYTDAVFTIGFIKTPKVIDNKEMRNIGVTMTDLSYYGVYFASFTYDKTAHVSITIFTENFNTDKFLEDEEDSFELFNSI